MLKPSPLVVLVALAAASHAAPHVVFQAQPLYYAQPGAASFYPLGSHVLLLPPRHDEVIGEAPEPPPPGPGFWAQLLGFFRPTTETPTVAPAEPQPAEPQPAEPQPAEPHNPPPADVEIPVVLPEELPTAAVVAEELPAVEPEPEDSTEKLAAIASPDREPLETPDAGPAPEPDVGVQPPVTRRFPAAQFFGSYDFLRSKDALLLLHQGSPVQAGNTWSDPRQAPAGHVVRNHVLPSHLVRNHVLPSHVVNVGPRYETVYFVRREGDDVAISAPTTLAPVVKPPGANSTEEEQAGPSVAQAKPQAIAVAGVGGVAAASPVATALVGPGGLAVAAPSATAIAGQTQGQLTAPALAAAAAAHKLRAPVGLPKKVAGYDEDDY